MSYAGKIISDIIQTTSDLFPTLTNILKTTSCKIIANFDKSPTFCVISQMAFLYLWVHFIMIIHNDAFQLNTCCKIK